MIKKFVWLFKIKFPTKRIFQIFPILNINGTYLSNDSCTLVKSVSEKIGYVATGW